MSLEAGTRLGPYEIVAPLGAGGMGEVYTAVDTRLGRTVAIKILSGSRTGDTEFQQRFEREARTVSALDHPHICSLFDVGDENGVRFFVMPFLDGETLAARLTRGRLPLDEALVIAGQMADALDAAHRVGIVHRDVKPGNVMLTRAAGSGLRAKLLDFGLAKTSGTPTSSVNLSPTVTQPSPITERGTVLGTAQYMSPEQVEGREADGRSDIFALGTVIYEMVSGRRAFEGKSSAGLMAAILEHQPPAITSLQPAAPAALDHLVQRCMAKNPDDRWASARDVRFEIEWIRQRLNSDETRSSGQPARRRLASATGALVVAVVLAAVGVGAWWISRGAEPAVHTTRLSFAPTNASQLAQNGIDAGLAVSPDGRLIAYLGLNGGRSRVVYVRSLDSFEATRLAGSEDGFSAFFSPDGQWVGFVANRTLKKAPIAGGQVVAVAELPAGVTCGRARWLDAESILIACMEELLSVPASGGSIRTVASVAPESVLGDVMPLPGGRHVLVAERKKNATWNDGRIVAIELQTAAQQVLIDRAFSPHYVDTGHMVFARDGQLFAVRFDPVTLTISGEPSAIPDAVTVTATMGTIQGDISTDGTFAYLPTAAEPARRLVWVDRSGSAQTALPIESPFQHPRVSPSGDRVVVGTRTPADVWVGDFARGTLDRLTFSPLEEESPVWLADGQRVTFAAARGAARHSLLRNADGSGDEELLFEHGQNTTSHHHLGGWSPDGVHLVFTMSADIHVLTRSGSASLAPFTRSKFSESSPSFSPDGRHLVFASNESGRDEVYVRPFPGPGGLRQISSDGGSEPVWSRDGRELFYRNGDRMMAVDVTLSPTFSAGTPRVLFRGVYERIAWGERNYDVSPDGKRFLMLVPTTTPQPEIRVITGWGEELRRLVR